VAEDGIEVETRDFSVVSGIKGAYEWRREEGRTLSSDLTWVAVSMSDVL
jgi:hypothetical protein